LNQKRLKVDQRLKKLRLFSEILPSNSWRSGPDKVGQGGQKALHL